MSRPLEGYYSTSEVLDGLQCAMECASFCAAVYRTQGGGEWRDWGISLCGVVHAWIEIGKAVHDRSEASLRRLAGEERRRIELLAELTGELEPVAGGSR